MNPTGDRCPAVIFDLDGTLLDTLEDLATSMNSVLAAHGYPTHAQGEYRYFVGEGMEMLVRRTLPADRRGDDEVAARLEDMRQEYGRRWAQTSRPYAGVPAMLDDLAGRGLAMAILSNKPDDFTRQTVATLLPAWSFADVRGMCAGVPPKPDPAGALAIASGLGLATERIVYVGDTATDMQTGTAAGMLTVGVSWGFREREELETHGAHHIIDAPSQLLDLTINSCRSQS